MKPKSLIIIPTYSELENIKALLPRIWMVAEDMEILLVNDDSGDGLPEWTQAHPEYGKKLHGLFRPSKMGLASAYLEGFRWGLRNSFEWIFQMDADLSHDPFEITAFLQELEAGYDVVLGSRYQNGVRVLNWPISRLLLSLGAAQYVRVLTGMPFTDPTGGYKAFRSEVLQFIRFDKVRSTGYAFQIEMTYAAWKLGFRIKEIPIIFEDRHLGTSKMSGRIAREAVWQVMRLALKRLEAISSYRRSKVFGKK